MIGAGSRTVLIVEDEWLVRMELAAGFEDAGWTILESGSAEDALGHIRAAEADEIDLLVTDIRLGGSLTGWDLACEARALHPAIAVIYVSANPPAPGRDVAGSVFIDKPALLTHVLGAANRLLDT